MSHLEQARERYRTEREKRIRQSGSRQYRRLRGDDAHYLDDPYTMFEPREPVHDTVDVAVLGGGFGGLLTGARLRSIGVESIRIIEQGGDFGGTWYWNRYPGAACDTESYIYMPLLEETGYIPTEKYAKAPEILAHCHRIGRQFDLYRDALLHTRVAGVRWIDDDEEWEIETDRDDRFRAKFVCMTTGPLTRPKLPGVEGIEDFDGHTFHTSRWDYEYTGGDSTGGMDGLSDKRVAVVGTGATAIQCVPMIARDAQHLYVVQRTPSAVNVRGNRPTDPKWAAALHSGWQRQRMDNFSTFVAGGDAETDLVNDGWTAIYRRRSLGNGILDEEADLEKMDEIRARVDSEVRNPDVAEALKPWYRALCKRPCFHDEYLPTYNRDNVTLVDTDGQGVERVTSNAIVVQGEEYEVDCIIFASGFEVGGSMRSRLGYDVYGREGRALSDKWKQGVSTLYGMQTHGFPNLFIIALAQVGVSSNFAHILDVQSEHIAILIDETRRRGASTIEATRAGEEAWVAEVIAASRTSIDFLQSCTPGYYNNEGQPNLPTFQRNGAYAPGIVAFDEIISAWRSDDDLPGLEFGPANDTVSDA